MGLWILPSVYGDFFGSHFMVFQKEKMAINGHKQNNETAVLVKKDCRFLCKIASV